MTRTGWEAIVVGAGPAGSAMAYHLARVGARVALVDRRRFPRPKTCGDGLTPSAVEETAAMGCLSRLAPCPRIDSFVTVDLAAGHVTRSPLGGRAGAPAWGTVVPRARFDHLLQSAAVAAGAHAIFGGDVRLVTRRHDVTVVEGIQDGAPFALSAPVVAIAEGATGRLVRAARGRPRASGIALRQYVRLGRAMEPAYRIYVPLPTHDAPLGGYGWAFPVSESLANVGVGCLLSTPTTWSTLRRVFDRFLAKAMEDPELAGAEPIGRLEGGWIPTGLRPAESTLYDRVLLVGDAAGAANPFTGEGIAQAMRSGRLAAAASRVHLDTGRSLAREYESRLRCEFPNADPRADAIDWYTERAARRTREVWAILAHPSDALSRAVRTVAFDGSPKNDRPSTSEGEALLAAAGSSIARTYPLLAEVLTAAGRDMSSRADSILAPLQAAGGCAARLRRPLGLLLASWLLATEAEVTDVPPDARWAGMTLRLALADVLLAQCFEALQDCPPDDAYRMAAAARQATCAAFARASSAPVSTACDDTHLARALVALAPDDHPSRTPDGTVEASARVAACSRH